MIHAVCAPPGVRVMGMAPGGASCSRILRQTGLFRQGRADKTRRDEIAKEMMMIRGVCFVLRLY